MAEKQRYNKLNVFLKNIFGERTLKICIDGNFSCPNRDGTKGVGGCIFCGERGSGENSNPSLSISNQVRNHLSSYRGKRANKFIVYFQNFSNTYDNIECLKQKYNSALIDNSIVGLSIATRPDCINDEIAKLLHSYCKKYYVCVELGLQTANEQTGKAINRCYTNSDFTNAVEILNTYGIDVITHIMVGLPNETQKDVLDTVKFINSHNVKGVKIHSTYVIKNTKLAFLLENGNYKALEMDKYIETLAKIITHLRDDIIIHRITGDAPKNILIAPLWNTHKKLVLNAFEKYMKENDLFQGIMC